MSLKKFFTKIVQAKPSMYSDSLVLNILGIHFLRIFFFYLRRVLRTPKRIPLQYQSILHELEANGAVAVPNFLSPQDYAHVRAEYDRLTPEFKIDASEIMLPHVNRMNFKDPRISNRTKKLFNENPMIDAIALGFLNRKYNLPLDAATSFTRIHVTQDELDRPQNGGTNNLHFDTPTRLLKCFYYPSNTTADNAAFYYCLGSNRRNSLKRLIFEYRLSVRYALNRWNPNTKGEYLAGEPWVKITEEEMRKHHLEESVMEVKGNTMLFADISGFHRRGEFRKPGVRETIEINYRSIEALRNGFLPLEKNLKNIFSKKNVSTLKN
jgi:hypothetical protein